jgi:MFS family permease
MDHNKKLLSVLLAGVFMATLDIAVVGPAIQPIQQSFGVNHRSVTWMFTIFVLFNLIGTPLLARMSDIYGRRDVYVANIVLFGIGSLLVAVTPWYWLALVGRAIQGFGAGGIFPVASATIGDIYSPEKRGEPLGLLGLILGLAFITGPVVAGLILLMNWRWIFIINLPIAIIITFIGSRILPSKRSPGKMKFDWKGMLLLTIMLTSLSLGVNHIDTTNLFSSLSGPEVMPYLIIFVIFIPFLIRQEKKASQPLISPAMFHTRQLVLSYALSFGGGHIEASMIFVPALTALALDVSSSTASFLLLPLVASMAVGAPLFGELLGKIGSRTVIGIGMSVLATGMFVLGLFMQIWALFFLSTVLIGIGLSVLFGAPIRYIMLNEAREEERGIVQAMGNIFTGTGQMVSSALIGAVISSAGAGISGYSHAYELTGFITIILLFLSFALKKKAEEKQSMSNSPYGHLKKRITIGKLGLLKSRKIQKLH